MKIWNFYTWENIDEKIWQGKLIEHQDNWLQFAILDEQMEKFDGLMIVNSDILENFSEMSFEKNIENILSIKSIEDRNFQKIMKDGLLVEIVAKMTDGLMEDDWDLFFEDWEYRFYPVQQDGVYLDDGYLPMQESNIASVYYNNDYLKNIEKLSIEKWYF